MQADTSMVSGSPLHFTPVGCSLLHRARSSSTSSPAGPSARRIRLRQELAPPSAPSSMPTTTATSHPHGPRALANYSPVGHPVPSATGLPRSRIWHAFGMIILGVGQAGLSGPARRAGARRPAPLARPHQFGCCIGCLSQICRDETGVRPSHAGPVAPSQIQACSPYREMSAACRNVQSSHAMLGLWQGLDQWC